MNTDTPAPRGSAGPWPLRSLLFVPAHRRELVAKSIRSGTDAVVLDLEDSVPHGLEEQALSALPEAVAALGAAGVAVVVRIHAIGPGTDAELARAVMPGVIGVILPKADSADEIRELDLLLAYHEGRAGMRRSEVAILPLPETARGLADARSLAEASERVTGILGAISGPVSADIARAFGFRASLAGTEQLYMNSKLVLDSRAGGAPWPLCGVFGVSKDELATIRGMIERARDLGYTGIPVMHPAHVPLVNETFTPTQQEYDYYRGLLAAFDEAQARGLGAVSYHGAMIDYAMLPLAREVVAEFERRRSAAGQSAS